MQPPAAAERKNSIASTAGRAAAGAPHARRPRPAAGERRTPWQRSEEDHNGYLSG
eukprot:COSAG02_NODE_32955_length_507_cov_11.855392_1_plen_54_part_01